uniref:ATP synthase complex subunit 8 n=1 Tax=Xixuthrus sp. ANIC_25-067096 TaxID=2546577 RepID=A0A6H0N4I9_9CUCU|nr:ATP synthase F0 subunit 8 [Xixuthrus sp. ANIC_25-067096]
MPQMAPLNWLILAILFTLIFLIFNVLNYFVFKYEIKSFKTIKTPITITWKW